MQSFASMSTANQERKKMIVSFIIPIYNAEAYLRRCLDSVVGQTYKDLEILLVDDGSPDESGKICDEYAEKDSRIRVFHKENGGTHTARNLGLAQATGDYVMFSDPDDWFDLDTVEQIVTLLEAEDLDVLRFNYVKEFHGESEKKKNTFLEERLYEGADCKGICRRTVGLVREELACMENFNFLSSVCFGAYRRSLIVQNGLVFDNIREIASFSDGLFNIKFLLHAERFRFMDRGFYHYRKTNAASATSNYRENFCARQQVMFEKMRDLIDGCGIADMEEAYRNRLAFSTMEMCNNALKKTARFGEKYREIKTILRTENLREACRKIHLSYLSFKWRVYYVFLKSRSVLGVYLITSVIRKKQQKGR